ncbi:MAG: exodeoxyribonuclease VII large subunit [Flavobacteriales bacterium]|nr:exodeoxyribonuclease VII large subunit [Flavobacteriales bacterium]
MILINSIYTVSRLNSEVRLLLETEMGIIWLVGEISNLSVPSSGHWYLTLKDSRAQIKCAMFKGNNHKVTFKPVNGQQVLVRARLSLYEPRGDYQLIIESMQPEGEGLLQQKFDQLKKQLALEGLFSTENKIELPRHPQRIGIITSPTGAALHDILHVLKRRDPRLPVVIYPTQVQGKEAAIQIAQTIGRANTRNECDVLIVGRGGGTLEDLWCFNEEIVARTISASTIPIISAVGHEVDITISDLVADVRAATPSAAAELISQDSQYRTQLLLQKLELLTTTINKQLQICEKEFSTYQHKLWLLHPKNQLQQQNQTFDDLSKRLRNAIKLKINNQKNQCSKIQQLLKHQSPIQRIKASKIDITFLNKHLIDTIQKVLTKNRYELENKIETLDAISPLSTLRRGFTATKNTNGKIIKSKNEVKAGDEIITVLIDGEIRSNVR